jgi:DNA-binding CsgD family transcriptional regulator
VMELEAQVLNPGPPLAAAMLVEVLLDRGDVEEAGVVGEGLTDPPPFGIMQHFVLLARGRLRRHQRRYDEALDDLMTSGRQLTEHGYDNPGFLLWRAEAALALLDSGAQREATRLVAEHMTLARQFGASRAIGVGLWVRAMTESGGARIATLTEADRVLERSTTVLPRIRVQVDLGAALRRAGRRGEAVVQLQSALGTATRCHAAGLAARAAEELAAAGVATRRATRAGRTALTASELRVARYAAEGMTNAQIAQSLFVSRRAVELHLTNAFRKLGIEGRDQLAEALEMGKSHRQDGNSP